LVFPGSKIQEAYKGDTFLANRIAKALHQIVGWPDVSVNSVGISTSSVREVNLTSELFSLSLGSAGTKMQQAKTAITLT